MYQCLKFQHNIQAITIKLQRPHNLRDLNLANSPLENSNISILMKLYFLEGIPKVKHCLYDVKTK